jgi:hypothetical protein
LDQLQRPAPDRRLLVGQLAGTLALLAIDFEPWLSRWPPGSGNAVKALVLVAFWTATFWPLSRRELALVAIIDVFFTLMDVVTVRRGLFWFVHPDVVGLPYWEPFMWGFYVLNAERMCRLPGTRRPSALDYASLIAFTATFPAIGAPLPLQLLPCALLVATALSRRDARDLVYMGYLTAMGLLVENVGTRAHLWRWRGAVGAPPYNVVVLWAAVGLYLRRVFVPWLRRGSC